MDYNALHPYPRYGAAAALNQAGKTPAEIDTVEKLAPLVADAIEQALTTFTVHTLDDPKTEGTTTLTYYWVKDPKPGKDGQKAPNAYYLAPHIITNDVDKQRYRAQNGLLKEAKALVEELRSDKPLHGSRYELKKSFAPLTAQVNSGYSSLRNPETTLINAALTALTSVTPDKASAWSGGTAALIPDLPLVDADDPDCFPLLDYVEFFSYLSGQYYDTAAAMQTPLTKDGGYKRPRLHDGNFPEAPSNSTISALGVVASVGWWARHGEAHAGRDPEYWARRVLNLLAERPLLISTYGYGDKPVKGSSQERFGQHLVALALESDLRAVTRAVNGVLPVGFEKWGDKASEAKVHLFRMTADRFLRLFTQPALRDFLAVRAAYPAELVPVFESYFTTYAMNPISPDLVASARAYGAALNSAAYRVAEAEHQADKERRKEKARPVKEYKQRALVEFESAVQSAKSGPELLAKVGSRAGRLAGYEMPPEAADFMEAVAAETIPLAQARDLVTAFMRLGTWKPKDDRGDGGNTSLDSNDSAPPSGSDTLPAVGEAASA